MHSGIIYSTGVHDGSQRSLLQNRAADYTYILEALRQCGISLATYRHRLEKGLILGATDYNMTCVDHIVREIGNVQRTATLDTTDIVCDYYRIEAKPYSLGLNRQVCFCTHFV